MIRPYKNRFIDDTRPVEVYRNLTKKLLSVRQDGKVVGHCEDILLEQCLFVVSEKGRQRVLDTKRKNVHAYVRGRLLPEYFSVNHDRFPNVQRVFYNPYENDGFVDSSERRIDGAPYTYITNEGDILIHY